MKSGSKQIKPVADKPIMTMKQIAELAGVSKTAVSAVLNQKRGTIRLSEATRRKIENVLREQQYRPNTAGKSLALGRSMMIGMIVTDAAASFIPQVIQAVEDYTQRKGYGLLLMTSRNDPVRQSEILDFMIERGVEGVLLNPAELGGGMAEQKLHQNKIPYVSLFVQPKKARPDAGYVYVRGSDIGYLAVNHLLEKGHRNILAINQCERTRTGMEKAIKNFGAKVRVRYDTMGDDERELQIVSNWLEEKKEGKYPVTGIFIRGDECACRVMNVAIRYGIRIPMDLAIIGVDDIAAATRAVVPLTTVSQPKHEQGTKACEMLFGMIAGQPGKEYSFAPALVVRQST